MTSPVDSEPSILKRQRQAAKHADGETLIQPMKQRRPAAVAADPNKHAVTAGPQSATPRRRRPVSKLQMRRRGPKIQARKTTTRKRRPPLVPSCYHTPIDVRPLQLRPTDIYGPARRSRWRRRRPPPSSPSTTQTRSRARQSRGDSGMRWRRRRNQPERRRGLLHAQPLNCNKPPLHLPLESRCIPPMTELTEIRQHTVEPMTSSVIRPVLPSGRRGPGPSTRRRRCSLHLSRP